MKIFLFLIVCFIIWTGCRKSASPPPPPGRESVNTLSGGAFTLVTLQGNGFKSDPYADTIKVNGVMATVLSASTTSITFSVPFCTGIGPITVTTSDGTLIGPSFTYLPGPDVYVSGKDYASNFKQRIKYWKNGIETWVTDGSVHSYSQGISVIGNDVFVSGSKDSSGYGLYKYWKTGTEVNVKNGSMISDKDLNAAITLNNQFWKVSDGLPFVNPGVVTTVNIAGGDIYTGGGLITRPYGVSAAFTAYAAKCWKNGVLLPIQDSATDRFNSSFINAMVVSGNDVYVAGYNAKGYAYWKNGVPLSLPNGRSVSGIAVIGNDVYVSGTGIGPGKNTAVYWKNGTQIQLSDSSYLSTGAEATGITAINNDVYICGSETYSNIYIGGTRFNYTYSKIWKNGIPLIISKRDANNYTTGIFVKP